MIPSAKIVNLCMAPPENIFIIPKSVPPCVRAMLSKNCASFAPSIPGVGINAPILYTAIRAAVIRILRFKSGILKRFANVLSNFYPIFTLASPPASEIFFLALSEKASTLTDKGFVIFPLPKIFTG